MGQQHTDNPPDILTIYGTTWCPDCKRSKQFLGDQRVRYQWVDIERDPEALTYVEQINNGKRIVPTIICPMRVVHQDTGEQETCQADGVFIFVDLSPNSGFLPDEFERDRGGFVRTDGSFQTSVKGVFAAGDVRAGATSQAAAAAGEGVTAALMIRDYLRE